MVLETFIVIFLAGLRSMNLLETVGGELVVQDIDGTGNGLRHCVRRRLIAFIVDDLKGWYARYRNSLMFLYVNDGARRDRNQDKERSY